MATASSRIVNKKRIVNVMVDTVMLMEDKASVAEPIRWMSRCPAVMLAVSRTARAKGWMKRLIVSMIISIGMRGVGVPCGRKWAKDTFGLLRKPIITVASHSGMAMPIFMESCVVGVKEYGSRPRRLVDAMKRIRDISIRAQVRPRVLCIDNICFVICRISQICSVWMRLGSQRFGVDKMIHGKIMIIGNVVIPMIVGVMNGANRFSFIFYLKVVGVLLVVSCLLVEELKL